MMLLAGAWNSKRNKEKVSDFSKKLDYKHPKLGDYAINKCSPTQDLNQRGPESVIHLSQMWRLNLVANPLTFAA